MKFFTSLRDLLSSICKVWLLGILGILAVLGYLFYFFLMGVRFFQMKMTKKITVTVIALAILLGSIVMLEFYPPKFLLGKDATVKIERGMSLKAISEELSKKKVLLNGQIFYYYMRLLKQSDKILAGTYRIPRNSGVIRVAATLMNPQAGGAKVQIREGLTIWETSQAIAKQYDISTSRFDSLCSDSSFVASQGFAGEKSLEGYLYPDTYTIPYNLSEEDVISFMVNKFSSVYSKLDRQGRGASFTRNQLVAMASIVEKEAQVPAERPLISAVFHNRVEQGIPLGADPTIRYAFKKFTGPLLQSELRDPNPYNTRIHKGLTPTPICSPGKASLEAAMKPSNSDELFFIAKWDGSGEHYFSKTNEEHEALKAKVRVERKDLSNW